MSLHLLTPMSVEELTCKISGRSAKCGRENNENDGSVAPGTVARTGFIEMKSGLEIGRQARPVRPAHARHKHVITMGHAHGCERIPMLKYGGLVGSLGRLKGAELGVPGAGGTAHGGDERGREYVVGQWDKWPRGGRGIAGRLATAAKQRERLLELGQE